MGIIFAIVRKEKAKVNAFGRTLNLLVLVVALSKCLAERISKEEGVSLEVAKTVLIDCIKDGMKTEIRGI